MILLEDKSRFIVAYRDGVLFLVLVLHYYTVKTPLKAFWNNFKYYTFMNFPETISRASYSILS